MGANDKPDEDDDTKSMTEKEVRIAYTRLKREHARLESAYSQLEQEKGKHITSANGQ